MLFGLLFSSPQMFLIIVLAIIFALTIHEFSHALAATALGDNTAKYSGRLSLNPMVHLDLWGTLMLLLAGFGWGRPVPINPYNMRWRRYGEAAVALAGPISNLLSVVLFVLIIKIFVPGLSPDSLLTIFLGQLLLVNLVLGVFNLIPIPPLDGSKVLFSFLPASWDDFKTKLTINGLWILIGLVILGDLTGFDVFGSIIDFFINIVGRFLS
ncbi:MAG: site-2 protease family protein [Parcubacteria group bacterium]|nr:MAG: site-2 protease family protein [Parcubacteria group bacterium]